MFKTRIEAVYLGYKNGLEDYMKQDGDELDKVMTWDLKKDIGHFDECEGEMKNMLLETKRLIIRSIRPTDEKAFIDMAADGSLWEIYGDCSECHIWMKEFISETIRLEAEDNPRQEYLAFAIEDKVKHLVVGSVGSTYYEDFMEVGVSYFIGANHRGNGYAAEALKCFIEYLFAKYHLKKLVATADPNNIASCKTLEKVGFSLIKTEMYQDMHDESKCMTNFYELVL